MRSDHGSVVKFMKSMTSIPEDFVDEILQFHYDDALRTSLVIDLDAVAAWLEVTKSSLVRTLQSSYKKDKDYNIFLLPGGKKRILITPICFKLLAMSTKSKKGPMIRAYYSEVGSLFIKYRDQMMAGIKQTARNTARQSTHKSQQL